MQDSPQNRLQKSTTSNTPKSFAQHFKCLVRLKVCINDVSGIFEAKVFVVLNISCLMEFIHSLPVLFFDEESR